MWSGSILAQTSNEPTWTMEKASTWVSSGAWTNGLKLKLHESADALEFAKQYHRNKALWDKAFAFLRDTRLETLTPGRVDLEGTNAYASVTEGPTKALEATKWEAHRKYIDLQYVITGKEQMGIAPLSKARVTEAYDEAKDVLFGEVPTAESKFYVAQPGTFFLFFPKDAHRPAVKADGSDTDKKVVIKIKAD
jgi:biofilm protein TabA